MCAASAHDVNHLFNFPGKYTSLTKEYIWHKQKALADFVELNVEDDEELKN